MILERRNEPATAYVALGSNLGDRIHHLRAAVKAFAGNDRIRVRAVSPVYETQAHTLHPEEEQPSYLNAVAELAVTVSPVGLLSTFKRLERAAGRDMAAPRWAPRPLDLDLLVYESETRRSDRLTLPHPRLGERRFVLRPWADLAPNLFVPAPFEARVGELLEQCPDPSEVVRTDHDLRAASRSR